MISRISKIFLGLFLMVNIMAAQHLKQPTYKPIPTSKFLFMTTPTIEIEVPKENVLKLKTITYRPDPSILNLLPAKETGFLSRIKVTVKFGFNMKSNLEMVEE